ncbi:MAG: hypothetical protein KH382_06170 [Clostridiales bacterium]|nr:hypothetical protein [Clostridiales bacterium]
MKRILAIVLSLAMILVVFLMAGCGENDTPETTKGSEPADTTASDKPGTSGGTSSGEETTGGSQSEDTSSGDDGSSSTVEIDGYNKLPGYEDVDFRGTTFVIVGDTATDDFSKSPSEEIYSEGTDTISVAVRLRNSTMEKLYNCKIELIASDNPGSLATADTSGNQHTIDMYTTKYQTSGVGTSGNNYNLYSFDLNFENEWWDQNYVNTYSINNSSGAKTIFSIIGDFALYSMSATHALMFNKTVYENAGIESSIGNIYDLVRENKWTMDKFVEMIKAAAQETSGNSEYHYSEGDILGWVRTGHATHGMHVASAMPIIANNNGVLSLEMVNNAGAWNDVIDQAISVWSLEQAETLGYGDVRTALQSGNTLFASEVIDILARMKDSDVSVGLVPYPMYSETQGSYAHYVDNHMYAYSVPVSVPDIDTLSDFMELYAYHSRYLVRSAWIEAYSYEFCSDADSGEMLGIILDSRTYDPAYLMFASYEGDISNMISTGKNNLTRWADRTAEAVNSSINNYVTTMSNANQ